MSQTQPAKPSVVSDADERNPPNRDDWNTQAVAFSDFLTRFSMPVADQGKCNTGMTKKLEGERID